LTTGTTTGSRRHRPEDRVGDEAVVHPGPHRVERIGLGARWQPVEPLGGGRAGVRPPEQLEVVVGLDQLVDPRERLVERQRALLGPQQVGRLALDRHRGEHPEGTQAEPGRLEDLRLVVGGRGDHGTVGGDQLDRAHLRRQAAEPAAGAVGAGRDGPGDGLRVDVAEVGHRQAERVELGVQPAQGGAGVHRDETGGRVGVLDAGQRVGQQLRAVGGRRPGERVAGADRLDPQPVAPGLAHRRDDGLHAARTLLPGDARLHRA
jgi:hypothetical protein